MSPYALSVSFLKDPKLLGLKDEFGQAKYKLNLDEEALKDFFKQLEMHYIHETHLDEKTTPYITDLFDNTMAYINKAIEVMQFCTNEEELGIYESEIVYPVILRAFIIMLLVPDH